MESKCGILNNSVVSANSIKFARNSLENGQENAEIANAEKSLTANAEEWVQVVTIEQLLFNNKLGCCEAL
jgi:hypothetical protein